MAEAVGDLLAWAVHGKGQRVAGRQLEAAGQERLRGDVLVERKALMIWCALRILCALRKALALTKPSLGSPRGNSPKKVTQ